MVMPPIILTFPSISHLFIFSDLSWLRLMYVWRKQSAWSLGIFQMTTPLYINALLISLIVDLCWCFAERHSVWAYLRRLCPPKWNFCSYSSHLDSRELLVAKMWCLSLPLTIMSSNMIRQYALIDSIPGVSVHAVSCGSSKTLWRHCVWYLIAFCRVIKMPIRAVWWHRMVNSMSGLAPSSSFTYTL
jgi:hypothetical protein